MSQTQQFPADLAELLATTDLDALTVTRYGYRDGRVVGNDPLTEPLKYGTGDELDQLKGRLAKAAGARMSNHESYEVAFPDGRTIGLWFYDWSVCIGTGAIYQPY